MSLAFQLVLYTVFPFWALMIAAPRSQLTARVLASPWVVIGPVLIYAWVVLPEVATILPIVGGPRPDLSEVRALLGTEAGATASWAHFLGFDLFVARFIIQDARERALPTWLLSAVLVISLMLGPLGLLCYLTLRSAVEPVFARRAVT
jgi:hypothetical protein